MQVVTTIIKRAWQSNQTLKCLFNSFVLFISLNNHNLNIRLKRSNVNSLLLPEEEKKFLIHVGVDFGTYGSGLSYLVDYGKKKK